MSIIGYEIFEVEDNYDDKSQAICTLLSLPSVVDATINYREKTKHPTENKWMGPVDTVVQERCSDMTPAERLAYYDPAKLKTMQFLIDNGWFPES